ncbi:hypothetical protein REPUB_Repub15cG0090800 [Reevesia pubescens]
MERSHYEEVPRVTKETSSSYFSWPLRDIDNWMTWLQTSTDVAALHDHVWLECDGNGAIPPASLFEITLGGGAGNDLDFYDVSFVDGYNLPLVAVPRGVFGACNATGCAYDLNMGCPKELQVVGGDGEGEGEGGGAGRVVACKSACEAFGLDQYCCSGEFANPTTCRPSFYSTIFKKACPRAYSYAYDDGTSIFTCKAYDYLIIFCPNSPRANSSNGGFTPPFNEDGTKGKVVQIVSSSSNILLPLPILILILILLVVNMSFDHLLL